MHRARIFLLLLFVSLGSASAWSAPAPEMYPPVTVTVSGVYSLTFNLNFASTLPAGSTITCKAQIVPGGSEVDIPNPQAAAIPMETATGVATVTGSTTTCAVEIPFSWTVNNAREGVALSYEIDAFNVSGSLPVVARTSIQQGIGETFPASGATSSLSFSVTF